MPDSKEILQKINRLRETYESMSIILNAVSQRVADLTSLVGTDQFSAITQWQTSFNEDVKQVRELIDQQYILLDKQRYLEDPDSTLITPVAVVSSIDEETKEVLNSEEADSQVIIEDLQETIQTTTSIESSEDAARSTDPDDFLVVEDRDKSSTWHLQVKRNGKPDHQLMGAAWAALHSGFRGNKYDGPSKRLALRKLKALYKKEKMDLPE